MMRSLISKLVGLMNRPMPLPVGMSEFDIWSDRIIKKCGHLANADSMKYVLASQILHSDAKVADVPDKYFIDCLRKAAANQVASQVFQDIKNKQAAEALAAQQATEATNTNEGVTSDGQKAE